MSWRIRVVSGHVGEDSWYHKRFPIGSVFTPRSWMWNRDALETEERDPELFLIQGTLILINSIKVRSGYQTVWEDESGAKHHMFHTELMEIMHADGIAPGGQIAGTFRYIKRGINIGIKKIGA